LTFTRQALDLTGLFIFTEGESPDTFRQKTGPRGVQAFFSFGKLQPDLTKFVPVPVKATLDKRVLKKAKNVKEKKSPISSGFAENGTDQVRTGSRNFGNQPLESDDSDGDFRILILPAKSPCEIGRVRVRLTNVFLLHVQVTARGINDGEKGNLFIDVLACCLSYFLSAFDVNV
jgi:hypothetical protein